MRRREKMEIAAGRPQACPHGSSLPCSQCLIAQGTAEVVVRKVTYDAVGGVMLVDNEVARDGVEDGMARDKASRARSRRGYARTRRTSRCSVCGQNGHTRQSSQCPGAGAKAA